ncbi:MAG: DNA mismatch repair protein MutS [Candidatus Aminicenantes bacterium]|nr:DNA mismatch repair protein MutS [Candidatus Aminicenantes bacterium]
MTDAPARTPMMEQYFRIKREHPEAILFFRLGDFYEMFYEDARTAAPLLEIALTSRQKIPMCGVPHHAVDAYLAKLLKLGYKVAVCEQLEDPRLAKGVVKRDVVRILTPGTAVEIEPESAKTPSFIAGLVLKAGSWGLALLDLGAGRIRAFAGGADRKPLVDELFKASPREAVFPREDEAAVAAFLARNGLAEASRSPAEDWAFDVVPARELLLRHFRVPTLAGFDLEDRPAAVAAAGGLLHYLKAVRKDAVALVHDLSFQATGTALALDAAAVRNLELVRNIRDGRVKDTLLGVIDLTASPLGGRLLRDWLLQPLLDVEAINARLDAVEELLGRTVEREEIRAALKGVLDLERLAGRVSLGVAGPRDLVALKRSLAVGPRLRPLLEPFRAPVLETIKRDWDPAEDVAGLIDRAILDEPAAQLAEGGVIKDGFDAALDELRSVSRSGKEFIVGLERRERERTGIGSLKVRFNKVFGYFIEVTKPNLSQVPADFIRKQTLVNAERFLTPELKDYEEKVLHAEERIGEIERRLFGEVRAAVARETGRLHRIAAALATIDVLAALAALAAQRGYRRPVVDDADRILIRDGRHPVVEVCQAEPFIPNDTLLDRSENQILIVTGPNMGGKSTYLRQVALITILAQMGSYVPAAEAAVGVVDRIYTRIGAMDFLSVGQSTFMVEMIETAAILNSATPRSLILLDEIGRGTSTFDGLSIAWAVAEHLHESDEVRAKTLFATHYHELTELALSYPRIQNHHVAVKEWKEEVVFLRKIVPGPSDRSYGIHVAKLAGLPRAVVDRAREILFNLEKQELDASGQPRLATRAAPRGDASQFLLFAEDRERALLEEIRAELGVCDLAQITPREALEILDKLKKKIV